MKIASAIPAMGNAISAWTPSRYAADPAMADQITGTIERLHVRGVASINTPAVKIVVGHGRPNVGILSRLARRRPESRRATMTAEATHRATAAGHGLRYTQRADRRTAPS
jgi:hypothetical protein